LPDLGFSACGEQSSVMIYFHHILGFDAKHHGFIVMEEAE
jgi:hypothetical protein